LLVEVVEDLDLVVPVMGSPPTSFPADGGRGGGPEGEGAAALMIILCLVPVEELNLLVVLVDLLNHRRKFRDLQEVFCKEVREDL
jgi:hypothetical protein